MKALGVKLRAMYRDGPDAEVVLPEHFRADKIRVRASDVDRVLQSSESCFQGIYPDDLIPIHTMPTEWEVLLQNMEKCPSYMATNKRVVREMGQKAGQENALSSVLGSIRNATGWPESYNDGSMILTVIDNYFCSEAQKLPQHPVVQNNFKALTEFGKKIYYARYAASSDKDPRGPVAYTLMHTLLDNFNTMTSASAQSSVKAYFYSAHDTTILALLMSLQLMNDSSRWLFPPYSTSLVLELRQKEDNSYYVNMLIGTPVYVAGDTTDVNSYTYEYDTQPLKCIELSDQCSLESFSTAITQQLAPPRPDNQGCCYRDENFDMLGCDAYATPFDQMPIECQMYRRFCPATACGSDHVLQGFTMSCLKTTSDNSSKWKGWAFAGWIILVAVLLIGGLMFFRRRRSPSLEVQYTNL